MSTNDPFGGGAPLGSLDAYATAYARKYREAGHLDAHLAGLRAVGLLVREGAADGQPDAQLRDEVAYWRADLAARIWSTRALYIAARDKGEQGRAIDLRNALRAALQAFHDAEAGEWYERCDLCGEFVLPGEAQAASEDVSGHARCLSEDGGGSIHPHGRADLLEQVKQAQATLDEPWPSTPAPAATPGVPDSVRALSEKIKSATLYARKGGFTRSTLFLTDEESNCILAALITTHPAAQNAATGAGPCEDDITSAMIQAGRYAANLNDGTLARIYLAMRTVEWEEAQASARDQPPASSGKVQLVEMDEIWTFKETRKYLLSEIERLRDDLHAVGKNLTGEQPEAVSCLDTAYGRTANISSILSNAPTATQIPASSDPAALAEQEEGDA